MRNFGLRVLRVFALALLAYLAVAWFGREGQTATGLWIGGAVVALALLLGGYSTLRSLRARREQSWERAIYHPELRERATRQLRKALARLTPVTHRTRSVHARLSVLLAELLDAQNAYPEAMKTIDAVDLTALSALEVALVRHTRAVTHLRGDDAQGALRSLAQREPSGDQELDQRLLLLEAYARIELGEVEHGLKLAEELSLRPHVHESVLLEARVVRAAGLDAAGRREEALVVLMALGRDTLQPLSELGQPRARALAKLALESSSA